jgi:FkbH-like protein
MIEPNSIFTLANFNLQNFNAALKKEFRETNISSVEYEQMLPYLLNLQPAEKKPFACICWLTMSDVLQASAMKLDLVELVSKLNQSFQYSIVILPSIDSPAFNMIHGFELRDQLFRLHLEISDMTRGTNMVALNPTPWMIKQGSNAVSDAMWYLTKTPFHQQVFRSAAETCKFTLNAFTGKTKKALILDLDDTLWGGIVGDDGVENLKIGGHDPVGEAFADFQRWIKIIQSWGVILCICSKNDEKIAWEVFEKHSGMILKKEDFVKWRVNWEDKAANIVEIVNELNLGMDSVVFLDDNPGERNRIRTALPGILVPDLPEDKMEYPSFIRSLGCFNSIALTEEDKKRTGLYKEETERKKTKLGFTSVDDWIQSLNIEVEFEALNEVNLLRAEQLLNKTNQMNLRTRRLSKEELKDWSGKKDHWFYVVHVKDIFGDNGITGLLGFHKNEKNELFLDDFVMSCRIMGRKIENKMLEFVANACKEQGCTKIVVEYLPTDKNKPVKDFFEKTTSVGINVEFQISNF